MSAPASPGPWHAATAATSERSTAASPKASAMTGPTSSTCARLAISGTTPPKRAWRSTWLDTTDETTRRPSSTTAAAVSSHDVSMPRMSELLKQGVARDGALDAFEQRGVVGSVDLVHPHHQCVFRRRAVARVVARDLVAG